MLKQSSFLWSTFILFNFVENCKVEISGMDLKGKVIKLARYLLYMYINGRRGKVRLGNLWHKQSLVLQFPPVMIPSALNLMVYQ